MDNLKWKMVKILIIKILNVNQVSFNFVRILMGFTSVLTI